VAFSANGDSPEFALVAMHICRECGAATERSCVNPESIISGLVKCLRCGYEGQLTIEIRERRDSQTEDVGEVPQD
jgi:hypothetical protein